MRPWAPRDVEDWPETVEILTASGRPWPKGEAVFDLRWHVDQHGRVPGRRMLRERWSWTDWQVRQLLADTDRWWDPSKGAAPSSVDCARSRAATPPPHRRHTAATPPPPTTTTNAENEDASATPPPRPLPLPSRSPPHARQDPPSPSPSPSQTAETATPVEPAAVLSTRARKALDASGLTGPESVAALTPSELRRRPGVGRGTVDEVVVWLGAHGLSLRPEAPRGPKPIGDPRVKALGQMWKRLWLERYGKAPAWDWPKDSAALARWGDAAGWDEADIEAGMRAYLDAESGREGVWPHDRAPGIGKATRTVADWLNAARTGAKGARASPAQRRGEWVDTRTEEQREADRIANEKAMETW